MEEQPGHKLAARLKAALEEQNRGHDPEADRGASEAARRARARVLEDLACFGRMIGHIEVYEGPRGVALRARARVLFFEPLGDDDVVRVRGTGLMTGVHRLVRRADDGAWVLGTFDRGKRERYRLLFDEGLAELLLRALHLPEPPEDAPARPPRNLVLSPVRPKA